MDNTKDTPTILSICTGYAGIELGIERIFGSCRILAYVERESFAIQNLVEKIEKGKLATAPIWTNVETFNGKPFRGKVNILTGGYPCQPFSVAGKRKGKHDERHLWNDIRKIIREVQPQICFFENVEGHITLGLSTVISDLEEMGYITTWGIFSAEEVGAPHRRKRIFIMGYSEHNGLSTNTESRSCGETGNNIEEGEESSIQLKRTGESSNGRYIQGIERKLSNPTGERLERWTLQRGKEDSSKCYAWEVYSPDYGKHWESEPNVGRVANGIRDRVDRIRLLGNGVVPQTAEKAFRTLFERIYTYGH